MNCIQTNPYRIAGILSDATAKELQKQKGKIKAFSKVGKEITSELDFKILNEIKRTEESIENAFSNIEQNKDKVKYSLFWFVNANAFDNTALEYLKNGNSEKAQEIWSKVTSGKEVSSSNYSAFNNIGTLQLLSKTTSQIKQGFEAKFKLIESAYFKNFVHSVADQTFTINSEKQSKLLVDELLMQFKNQYSSADALELFSNCSSSIQKYLYNKFTEEPLHNIEISIEAAKKKRTRNKADAYSFGLNLFVDSKDDLQLLKSLLGSSDLKYKMTADNVAKEVMQCSIDYFNESQENDSSRNYLEESMKLVKLADSIAVSKLTKDRAKDNLASLAEMKDKDLNLAIAVLKSIEDAYKSNKSQIYAEVAGMNLGFNQSVNWTKVKQMIEKSIKWDKATDLVSEVISLNTVSKIQSSDNTTKVREFKRLVDFLFSKIGPIQINRIKHICYWKDVRAAQAKSTAKKVGTTVGKATEGCYIATMAYGDYEHPQVIELREFRDNTLQRSTLGRSFIKFYYKYSPKLVKVLKNKQHINSTIRGILDAFVKTIKK